MALALVVASLAGLAQPLQEHYKPGEGDLAGKFVLDATSAEGLEVVNPTGLKSALTKEKAKAKAAEDKLKTFKLEDGTEIDPVKAKEALTKYDELLKFDPEKKVSEGIKAREQQLIEQHKREKETLDKDLKNAMTQLEANLVTASLTKAIVEEKGAPELLLPALRPFVRMRKTDSGKFIAEVVDADGNARVGDSNANPMTIPQLVQETKKNETYGRAFDASGASGSGAAGSGGGGKGGGTGTPIRIKRSDQKNINENFEKIATGEAIVVDG